MILNIFVLHLLNNYLKTKIMTSSELIKRAVEGEDTLKLVKELGNSSTSLSFSLMFVLERIKDLDNSIRNRVDILKEYNSTDHDYIIEGLDLWTGKKEEDESNI